MSGTSIIAQIFVSNVRQLFAADDFSRCHFSDAFIYGVLRVKKSQKQNTGILCQA